MLLAYLVVVGWAVVALVLPQALNQLLRVVPYTAIDIHQFWVDIPQDGPMAPPRQMEKHRPTPQERLIVGIKHLREKGLVLGQQAPLTPRPL